MVLFGVMCWLCVLCSSTLSFRDLVIHSEVRPVCEDVRLLHKRLFETLVSSKQYARFASQIQSAHISIPLSNLSNMLSCNVHTTIVAKSLLLFIQLKTYLRKNLHWITKAYIQYVSNQRQREGSWWHVVCKNISEVFHQQQHTEISGDPEHPSTDPSAVTALTPCLLDERRVTHMKNTYIAYTF